MKINRYSTFESDIFNKQTIRVDNTYRAEFMGEEGLYELAWYVDEDLFSLVFPMGKIQYYRIGTLSPENDESNPLASIEDGKLISWIRHMIYSEDYNRTAIASEYKIESKTNESDTTQFVFNDGTYTANFSISKNGTIILTFPERTVVGKPNEILTDEEMGNLNSYFGGRLLISLRNAYEMTTGKKF